MNPSIRSLLGLALLSAACSSDAQTGTGHLPARDGGTGGSSAGGATGTGGTPGTQCRTTGDCPQLGCYMCPARVCINGYCVSQGPVGTGTGGAVATDLKWFSTCGPPVCQAPSGTGGSSSGVPACATTEVVGASCTQAGAQCDSGAACTGPLMCATSDPTNGGQCPRSRATYKTDIEYVGPEERAKLASDVQSIPLVRYRYKDSPEREHLGFIIEDVEPSPGVDSQHDRVDLYGYTSMTVAALQEQQREIDALRREVDRLRAALGVRNAAKHRTPEKP